MRALRGSLPPKGHLAVYQRPRLRRDVHRPRVPRGRCEVKQKLRPIDI